MTRRQRAHIIASIGTALFLLLLFLLLWFVYIGSPATDEDEGIEIAFGETEETTSYASDMPALEPSVPQATAAPEASSTPTHNDLMTQEDEESLALARQREEEEERLRQEAEAERLRIEQAAAEQKARKDAAIAKASQMGSLFGKQTAGGADNAEKQSGSAKGNPVPGKGTVGGNSWSLAGRSVRSLPPPSTTYDQEGKVVVLIRVDADGNVVEAQIQGGTISSKQTQELARQAALKAKFSAAEKGATLAQGTITYEFSFF